MLWLALAFVGLCFYAGFLFIRSRRLGEALIEARAVASEHKSLFNLSQEENKDLKTRLENINQVVFQREADLANSKASLTWANQSLTQKEEELLGTKKLLLFEQEQYKKLIGQKKSSEVRVGKITEQISPFLADYPLDPKNAKFIGDPIDLISFDPDKITFVEVKSGNSQLNKRQREIRDMIKSGKVDFIVYRVKGE